MPVALLSKILPKNELLNNSSATNKQYNIQTITTVQHTNNTIYKQ
jgi:hypothetical protein